MKKVIENRVEDCAVQISKDRKTITVSLGSATMSFPFSRGDLLLSLLDKTIDQVHVEKLRKEDPFYGKALRITLVEGITVPQLHDWYQKLVSEDGLVLGILTIPLMQKMHLVYDPRDIHEVFRWSHLNLGHPFILTLEDTEIEFLYGN